ncbi:CocE/NonD family hydrolase [Streptomyces pharetrae]|uniref:alpha/beta hydrolase family protein n=1 Tax=Streptomyces pharetrae TaxID=291370 RepID=UPI003349F2E1
MRTKRRTPGRRGWRWVVWALVGVLVSAAGIAGVVVWQNTYALREETVSLRHDGKVLKGVLARPETGGGPFGLVVFVHGDGPVDATHETFYRPLWESFARAGYASLSFDKPGTGGSEGDWLDQSMADRADETLAAVAWARGRPDIDGRRIGLWGASQAGWVLPKVATRDRRLQFVIAVSPAVNWLRQGRYNLLAELRRDGATAQERQAALRRRQTTLDLLERGASFAEYRAEVGDVDGMTPARWSFIAENYRSDATADLCAMRGTPVLLVLAGHDINVDVAETEAVYREILPARSLTVAHYPAAAHSLVDHDLERSRWRLTLTAIVAPRKLYTGRFLAEQAWFVQRLDTGEEVRRPDTGDGAARLDTGTGADRPGVGKGTVRPGTCKGAS